MIKRRHCLLAGPAWLSLQALAATGAGSAMGRRLMALLEQFDQQDLRLDPQAAVLRGDTTRAHEFGDYISDAHHRQAESQLRGQWRALGGVQRSLLRPGPERVAYDMARYQLQHALRRYSEGHVRFAQQMPLDHLFGQHVAFAQFSSGQAAPFKTVKDYDDGLARIEGFVVYLARAQQRMQQGLKSGRVLPRLVVERVLAQLDSAIATATEDSPYFGPLKQLPASFAPGDRQRLQQAYQVAIEERIKPALQALATFLRHSYRAASRNGNPGVGALPGGRAYYDYQLQTMTTLPISADAIHRTGLAEVTRIRAAMQRIQRQLGHTGTLAQFFQHLKEDPQYKFGSAAELLSAYEAVGRQVDALLPRYFSRLPASRLEIRPVPRDYESAAGGAYYQVGAVDGSRPGIFYVNTSDLPSRTSLRLTALYLHEALPGHHLQGSLAQEATHLPPLLRFNWNVGYGEGWALYCEWLGHEMGLYGDALQHFGQLDMEMFRAVRLVVDTGLHARGWSRERAVDYLLQHTSLERSFIEQEVDRYITWPAQATAYKLGELTLRRLRARAERQLGARFDLRAFHSQVLDTGALPLAVLEQKIKDWIKETRR